MDNIWNIALQKIDGNKVIGSDNNPSKSGDYLCTCIKTWYNGDEIFRYLQVMHYEKNGNYWHDCDSTGISHNILAWTNKIKPCEFTNFNYIAGGAFVEKQDGE